MIQKFKTIFLQNNTLKQTMLKNILWLFLTQISRLLRIATLLYAARALGASEYGVFSYIIGIIGIFAIFADMGINSLIIRDAAGNPQKEKEYFVTSFWIKLLLTTLTSIVFLILAPYFIKIQSVIYLIPLASSLIIFDNIRDFIISYLRGLEKMEKETLIITILNITLAFLGFTILLINPTAKNFFEVYVVSSGLATLAAIIIIKKAMYNIFNEFKKNIAKEIIKNGWPIAISGVFGMLMLNIDIFMLGLWSTPEQIGLYSAGQKIIQVLYTFPVLIGLGIFPATAIIVKNGNKEQERNLIEKSISAIFLFTIPLIIGGIILAEPIFKFVFGMEYVLGVPSFIILLLNMLLLFPGVILSNLILAHNKQRKMFKYIVIGSLINVILNIILIPKIGIIGSALATLFAQIVNYGLSWYEIKKTSYFEITYHFKQILIASLLMGIVSLCLNKIGTYLIINIILSGLVYVSTLLLLKVKIINDIKIFIKNMREIKIKEGDI